MLVEVIDNLRGGQVDLGQRGRFRESQLLNLNACCFHCIFTHCLDIKPFSSTKVMLLWIIVLSFIGAVLAQYNTVLQLTSAPVDLVWV